MPFKINVSHKGKTFKAETDNEELLQKKIGDKISGDLISKDLSGYDLEITGTSDIAGFPGIKGQVGAQLRRLLLTKNDLGMNAKRKGLRLRKSVRGEEISEKTIQINTTVKKEGSKKFQDLFPKPEEKPAETPAPLAS